MRVNLTAKHPVPELVGRFEGLSTASAKIDDKLFLADSELAVATRREHDWGVATFAPAGQEFQFRSVGDELIEASPSGLFTERTSYGTVLGGSLDWATGSMTRLFEDRPSGQDRLGLRWLDFSLPGIAVTRSTGGTVLRDCESGAELPISPQASARRAGRLVIVWSPASAPSHAYVYDPAGWRRMAEWAKH